jgi:uncharacterized protein YdeI (YjbR/CyaY-like superfamily)
MRIQSMRADGKRGRPVKPTFFPKPLAFRTWLKTHHLTAGELLVGFYKKATDKPSITWPESVDQALCFGWIDGIRRRLDDERYTIRFTPRRATSIWSAVNIRRVGELHAQGLMQPAGLEAFARRDEERSRIYSYEQRFHAKLAEAHEKELRANRKAWAFFQAQAPSYQRVVVYRIVSARQDETRIKRLNAFIEAFAKGRRA